MQYECEQARVYAGISIQEWDAMPGNRLWLVDGLGRCKSDIVMLFRMSNFIPAAASDLQIREQERKSKHRGR